MSESLSATRERAVQTAIDTNDLPKLQEISLLQGGFGMARGQAWPCLLGVVSSTQEPTFAIPLNESFKRESDSSISKSWTQSETLSELSAPNSPELPSAYLSDSPRDGSASQSLCGDNNSSSHPDEHQVQLDTDRSFILYPIVDHSTANRKHLQHGLHDIILGVLRKRPPLRYFQGYHDIITVLYLTLPMNLILPTAEKLSLHRLRDSMGNGLEPLVGQLRILKRLLRMVDPAYAKILEQNSPLPYYALSNLLTLFAHDVPSLRLIQHVFDWLLCREPVASIWLAAAVRTLYLASSYHNNPSNVILSKKDEVLALEREGEEAMGMMHAVLSALPLLSEDEPHLRSRSNSTSVTNVHRGKDGSDKASSVFSDVAEKTIEEISATSLDSQERTDANQETTAVSDSLTDSWTTDVPQPTLPLITSAIDCEELDGEGMTEITRDLVGRIAEQSENEPQKLPSHPQSQTQSHSLSTSQTFPGEYKEKKPPARPLPLPALLRRASDLLVAYPPSSPPLRLTETFGSQSAMRTNGLDGFIGFFDLEDDEAEACVGGDDVVLPLSPEEEHEEEQVGSVRRSKGTSPTSYKGNIYSGWFAKGMVVQRQTVIAGVVIFLGVAVALYGIGPRGRGASPNGGGIFGRGSIRLVAGWLAGITRVGEMLGMGL